MKFIKNKLLKLSIIFALLFGISTPNVVLAMSKTGNLSSDVTNSLSTGFFTSISNAFKKFTNMFSKNSGVERKLSGDVKILIAYGAIGFLTGHLLASYVKNSLDVRNLSLFGQNSIFRLWELEKAFKANNIEKIKQLFSNVKDINAFYCAGYRPIDFACKYNNVAILQWLIEEKNAKINNPIETYKSRNIICNNHKIGGGAHFLTISPRNNSIEIAIKNNSFDSLDYLISNFLTNKNYVKNIDNDYLSKKALNDNDYIKAVIEVEVYFYKNVELVKHFLKKKNFEINIDKVFGWIEADDGIRKNNRRHNEFEIAKYLIENRILEPNDKILKSEAEKPADLSLIVNAFMISNIELIKYLIENGAKEHLISYAAFLWDGNNHQEKLMWPVVKYLVNNGIYIHEGYRHENIVSEYEAKMTEKQANLMSKVGTLIDDLSSDQREVFLNDSTNRMTEINNLFADKEMPLIAKQFCLCYLVEFYNNDKKSLQLNYMKELYAKIEFNYTFLNNQNFKEAVRFAQNNNLLDINKKNILKAKLIYGNDKVLAKAFETDGALQYGLSIKNKDMLNESQKMAKQDYDTTLDFLQKEKKKKQLIKLENTRIILRNFEKKTNLDVSAKIIGFSDVSDFGDKVDGINNGRKLIKIF